MYTNNSECFLLLLVEFCSYNCFCFVLFNLKDHVFVFCSKFLSFLFKNFLGVSVCFFVVAIICFAVVALKLVSGSTTRV